MSNAPERIWADGNAAWDAGSWGIDKEFSNDVEYIRANRIEELEKACKEWADISQSNYQRAKAAEAKLEVAMVAFTDLEQDCEADYPPSYGAMKYYIQRALAELKGDQP